MAEKLNILVVDDDNQLLEMLSNLLVAVGYKVKQAKSLFQARGEARRGPPDLVILDRNLPDGDGLGLVQELRACASSRALPVLFLTGLKTPSEKAEGLRSGGDDYIAKPFSNEELLARIEALLRRCRPPQESPRVVQAKGLTLDVDRHVVELQGKPVHLSPREFVLLAAFLEASGRVLSRAYLLERAWGAGQELNLNFKTVDVAVGRLRDKLGPWGKNIVTVQSFGYRLDAED